MIHGLNIALSDTDLVVWAADASLEQDYLCARCGVDVRLDASHNVFRHPETRYCSESLSLRKGSLLYVQRLLECGQHLQLLKRCRKCHQEGVGEIFLDSFGGFVVRSVPTFASFQPPAASSRSFPDEFRSKIVTVAPDLDALWFEDSITMLVFMRSGSVCQRRFAVSIGAFWLELDARNIVSGTPVVVLDCSLPAYCMMCNCSGEFKKLRSG